MSGKGKSKKQRPHKKESARNSMADQAGLNFQVRRAHQLVKHRAGDTRVSSKGVAYMCGALEYLIASVLNDAVKLTKKEDKRERINEVAINYGLKKVGAAEGVTRWVSADVAKSGVFKKAVIIESGKRSNVSDHLSADGVSIGRLQDA